MLESGFIEVESKAKKYSAFEHEDYLRTFSVGHRAGLRIGKTISSSRTLTKSLFYNSMIKAGKKNKGRLK